MNEWSLTSIECFLPVQHCSNPFSIYCVLLYLLMQWMLSTTSWGRYYQKHHLIDNETEAQKGRLFARGPTEYMRWSQVSNPGHLGPQFQKKQSQMVFQELVSQHFVPEWGHPGFVMCSSGSDFLNTWSTLPLSRTQKSAGQPHEVPPHLSPGPVSPLICSFSYWAHFLNEEGCSALRTYKWLALTCQAWSLYFTRPIMDAIFLSKICIPPFLKSNDSNFFPSAHFLSVSFNGTCETDRRRDEKWKRAVD